MTVFFWSLLRFLCWYQNAHQQYHKQMHFIWSNKKKLRRQNEIKPESVNWLIDFSQKVTYTIIALLFFCSSMSFSRLLYFGTLRPSVLPQSLKKIGVDSPCDLWWKEERALFPKCVAKPCVCRGDVDQRARNTVRCAQRAGGQIWPTKHHLRLRLINISFRCCSPIDFRRWLSAAHIQFLSLNNGNNNMVLVCVS